MRLRGNPRGAVAPATAVRESVSVDQAVRRALAERETVDGPRRQAVHAAFRETVYAAICPTVCAAVRPPGAGPIHAAVHVARTGGAGGREAAGPQARDRRPKGPAPRVFGPVRPLERIPGLHGAGETGRDLTLRSPTPHQGRGRMEQGGVAA